MMMDDGPRRRWWWWLDDLSGRWRDRVKQDFPPIERTKHKNDVEQIQPGCRYRPSYMARGYYGSRWFFSRRHGVVVN